MINSPSLLLADEPTGNLDTRTSHEIMQTLTQLNREEGVTIVLVTHEPDIAAYADRTVTMRDGRILTDERKKSAIPAMPMAATDLSIFHPHSTTETASGATLSWAFGLMILAAAVQALARNKMRSALTMLGVFIGVAALIVMVAIGQGANDAVKKQLASLGTDLIVVVPGAVTSMGARGGSGSAEARELFLHGIVGALPDGNHDDQRRYADKDAEHGQRRAHLVARKRLHCRRQDHQAEGPGKRGAARGFCR